MGISRSLPPLGSSKPPCWGQGRTNHTRCPEEDVEAIVELCPNSDRATGEKHNSGDRQLGLGSGLSQLCDSQSLGFLLFGGAVVSIQADDICRSDKVILNTQ